jgi:uncharacterized protein
MIQREINLIKTRSFFLFGARGTGKTSLLRAEFRENVPLFNLLQPKLFQELQKRPESFETLLPKDRREGDWIIIDEIQRVPELLNIVHDKIESEKLRFVLTGSSARKLKRSGVNLLAGRAIVHHLFPFTHRELKDEFDLCSTLHWGSLPILYPVKTDEERKLVLESYVNTYIREEIREEQIVRKLDPFLRFLEVAAQMNGNLVNASAIGEDVRTDAKTIQRYYEILEDTLLGFHIDAFHTSIRRAQRQAPKFYFFDTGVLRALSGMLHVPLVPSTSEYGKLFESFFINEAYRLNKYTNKGYKFYYLRTKDDLEIDLILERKGEPKILIEIKSSSRVDERKLEKLRKLKEDLEPCVLWVASQEEQERSTDFAEILPWKTVLKRLF